MIVIFAGPTISVAEITSLIACECRPPVQHGDILKLVPEKPSAIGIIDGYFEGAPSVWHKEILYAMDQGIAVFGSASMGALRSAELHPFGMHGVGQIFEWYEDGTLTDDDEVAVLHGPQEVEFLAASEPMVNIRATLDLACKQRLIDSAQKNVFIRVAKNTFYKKRGWNLLLNQCVSLLGDASVCKRLHVWLQTNKVDLKKQDAVQMLTVMNQFQPDESALLDKPFHFEWTHVWDDAYHAVQTSDIDLNPLELAVLNQLRLDPDNYEKYRDKALLGYLAGMRTKLSISTVETNLALKKFRSVNRLTTRAQLQTYMRDANLNESRLTALLEDTARIEQIRNGATNLPRHIIDQLKLDGYYFLLIDTVEKKNAVLNAANLTAADVNILPPQLLAWYFEHQLCVSIPHRLEEHLDRTGFNSSDDFYRSIAEDYLYWREQV